jgi:hypothetical protein
MDEYGFDEKYVDYIKDLIDIGPTMIVYNSFTRIC